MMVSCRVMNDTTLVGRPSANMVSACRGLGGYPAASIWLYELRHIEMYSGIRTPPRAGKQRSRRRRASIFITAE
jgi:hypothetical protein